MAFCVLAGVVLAKFADGVVPTGYLWRPLAGCVLVALAVGAVSLLARDWSTVAAAVLAIVVASPGRVAVLVALMAAVLYLSERIWRLGVAHQATVAAAAVWLVSGVILAVPFLSLRVGTPAEASEPGPATYVILLDGYPRGDTLASLGVDISDFVSDLEDRGFTYYSDARSAHSSTFRSLSALLAGHMEGDGPITDADKRRHQGMWTLPPNWVTVAPPVGHVTIPGATNVGPAGLSNFEIELLASSLPGRWLGGLVMDQLRSHLHASLDTIEAADHPQMFAHLLSPHTPYLYEGGDPAEIPDCWPGCHIFDPKWDRDGMAGTLEVLNGRLLVAVDSILDRFPDARIVLMSDHGGRFDDEEKHRIFLASNFPIADPPSLRSVGAAVFGG